MTKRPWTMQNITRLREMAQAGLYVADAAAELDRTEQAIHHISRRCGIRFARPNMYRTREGLPV
jgi:hypothetical protein